MSSPSLPLPNLVNCAPPDLAEIAAGILDKSVAALQGSIISCNDAPDMLSARVLGPRGVIAITLNYCGTQFSDNLEILEIFDGGRSILRMDVSARLIAHHGQTLATTARLRSILADLAQCLRLPGKTNSPVQVQAQQVAYEQALALLRAAANAEGFAGEGVKLMVSPDIGRGGLSIKLQNGSRQIAKASPALLERMSALCQGEGMIAIQDKIEERTPDRRRDINLAASLHPADLLVSECPLDPVATLRALPDLGQGPWFEPTMP
jgi:hypothetical protein